MLLSLRAKFRRSFAELMQAPGPAARRFFAWLLGFVLLSPVFFILWNLLSGHTGDSWAHIQQFLLPEALKNTFILVLGTGLLTLLLGVPPAWMISRFRFPGRKIFSILLILPLAIPPYIAAYLTTDLREALVPWLVQIRREEGVESYLRVEEGLRYFWLILVLTVTLFPYLFLASRSVFANHPRSLGEASRLLGASPWRTFFTVHLPLVRPALVAGLFLTSMEVLSDYGAAKHLGLNTLTVIIFRTWFGLDELGTARYLAGWLLLGILTLLAIERLQRGRARFTSLRNSPSSFRNCSPAQTLVCWFVCGLPLFLGFLYPLFKLMQWQLTDSVAQSWLNYSQELIQTLSLGLGATTSCLIASLTLLGMDRFTRKRKDQLFVSFAGTAGYATPGTVMAVGILGVASWTRDVSSASGDWLQGLLVSGSFLWIFFGLAARYLTVSSQVLASGYQAIPRRYDEAAQMAGRSPASLFCSIHLPLLRTPLLSAGVLVFVDVSKELPLTLLLRPFDLETLGTTAYSYANQGHIFACATPALLLIILSAGCLLLVELFGWKNAHATGAKK